MGIYDREYYRESTQDRWSVWFARRGTVALVVVVGCVYLLQLMTRQAGNEQVDLVAEWGRFDLARIYKGEVWRLVTAFFLHDSNNAFHFLFNVVVLYWFGSILEGVYGTKELVTFYLVAGVVVSLAKFVTYAAGFLVPVPSLGASGAVTAVLVLFACHFPNRRLWFFMLIPLPAWMIVTGLILFDLLGVMGLRRDNVNYIAHLFGAAFGFVYFFFQLRVSNWLPSLGSAFSRRAARPRMRVASAVDAERPPPTPPEPAAVPPRPAGNVDEQLEAKLDNVLEKVARLGKSSLTPEENDILMRASEIYKRRRGS